MWTAILSLIVEIVKLMSSRAGHRKRMSDSERELAEAAVQRSRDIATAQVLSAKDRIKSERHKAKEWYENVARDAGRRDLDGDS